MSEKMKTIDERVGELKTAYDSTSRRQLVEMFRSALLEVARDQRHACAEAVSEIAVRAADEIQIVRNTLNSPRYEQLTRSERSLRDAGKIVMNANISKENP